MAFFWKLNFQNYYSLKEIVPLEQVGEAEPPPPQILDTPLPGFMDFL